MTTEEITEREQATARYCAWIDRHCRALDHNSNRTIEGLPWTTRSASDYAPKPEIRRLW